MSAPTLDMSVSPLTAEPTPTATRRLGARPRPHRPGLKPQSGWGAAGQPSPETAAIELQESTESRQDRGGRVGVATWLAVVSLLGLLPLLAFSAYSVYRSIDEMQAQAKKSGAEASEAHKKNMQELQAKRAAAAAELDKLEKAGATAWTGTRDAFAKAYKDLTDSHDKASSAAKK